MFAGRKKAESGRDGKSGEKLDFKDFVAIWIAYIEVAWPFMLIALAAFIGICILLAKLL